MRDAARIDQQRRAGGERGKRFRRIGVSGDAHGILRERPLQRLGHLAVADEEGRFVRTDQRMRDEHRVVAYIAAAQIEDPREIVEHRDEVPLRSLHAHRVADVREFLRTRDAGVRRGMLIHRCSGQRGVCGPHGIEQIDVGAQHDAARAQRIGQPARHRDTEHRAIDRDHAARGHVFGEPVDVRRGLLAARHLHQLDAAPRQLRFRLRPVTAIDPHAHEIRRYDQRADRTGETRQPLTPLPVLRQIFRQMRIGGGISTAAKPSRDICARSESMRCAASGVAMRSFMKSPA